MARCRLGRESPGLNEGSPKLADRVMADHLIKLIVLLWAPLWWFSHRRRSA